LRAWDRSRKRSRKTSRCKGVLSRREKFRRKRSWLLQKGGGGEKPRGFPSSSSLIENGGFRREKGEFRYF
jgi:hypothetical protein